MLIRPYNMATRAAPFDSLRIDDTGDVATNPYNLLDSVARIEAHFTELLSHDVITVALGGDHTIVLPILRAMRARHGPVGLVHVDAHTDINDEMFGERIAHGTPFRRAVEEGLLDCSRVVQIGMRATGYAAEDFDWSRQQGFRVVQVEECWYRSLAPLMDEVREQVGGGPVYLSFDIDGLDPSFAPGTGTPEIGGLTTPQALEIIRGCRGLDLVGCDMVEVAPIYDASGMTAHIAADLVYEMLCVLPGVEYRDLSCRTEGPANARRTGRGQVDRGVRGDVQALRGDRGRDRRGAVGVSEPPGERATRRLGAAATRGAGLPLAPDYTAPEGGGAGALHRSLRRHRGDSSRRWPRWPGRPSWPTAPWRVCFMPPNWGRSSTAEPGS